MEVGLHADGTALSYDSNTGRFVLGALPISIDTLRIILVTGRITWASDDIRAWFEKTWGDSALQLAERNKIELISRYRDELKAIGRPVGLAEAKRDVEAATDRVGSDGRAPKADAAAAARLRLVGRQGKTIIVDGDTIRIEKRGVVGKRERAIPIRSITSVEVKRPGGFAGFIQFSIAGGHARDASYTLTGGAFDAVKDENSVIFGGMSEYNTALEIKSYVEKWGALSAPPAATVVPVVESASQRSMGDQIRELKGLLDEGLITQVEFDQKKKQLLEID